MPAPVHRHACGRVERRPSRRVSILERFGTHPARNGRDRPGGVDLADPVVARIGKVEVARAVHRYACGRVDLRLSRRSAVTADTALPRARHGRDRPGGVDLADPVVAGIGKVEVARAVHRYAIGSGERRLSRRPAIAAETELPRARHGRDRPGGVDLADAVVASVGDVEVARTVDRHTLGTGDPRLSRRAAVLKHSPPGESIDSIAGLKLRPGHWGE